MTALINSELILRTLTHEAPWSASHGADGGYLGTGIFYYTLVYALQARVAVCLGSGGGFVPRLMRQAQRDLGIAHQSRTILVDANLPDAGWGAPAWLEADSFFRSSYPDVELVLQTTREAAAHLFTPNGICIDYLHVDADHSLDACLDDFTTYRPFLRTGSVVTFHDTNFPGAGVRYVVDHLRGRSDCEVIDFADRGTGLGLVRISSAAPAARDSGDPDREDAVRITRKGDAPLIDPPLREWKYLASDSFQARNVLAAHYVRGCPGVIEIGGWKTPIDRFLTDRHRSVLVVDPLIRECAHDTLNGAPCRVRHVRARFQDLWWQILHPREYGLVILGLELQGLSADDEQVLWDLINGSRATVIEFPSSWEPSRNQYARLRAHTRMHERMRMKVDLSDNDFGDMTNSWPPRVDRELHVLQPT